MPVKNINPINPPQYINNSVNYD